MTMKSTPEFLTSLHATSPFTAPALAPLLEPPEAVLPGRPTRLLIATDGNTKLYLLEPNPTGFKALASAEILEAGDNWAPLALADGRLIVRGQKQMKALQVAP